MRVAVVGAGICGLSAARWLAQRGHQVTLFERFGPFHTLGSSHGRSRIVRRAYPDPFYTACMAEAYPLWADLQSTSELPILHEVGLLYFGSAASPNMVTMAEGLANLGVPFEALEGEGVRRVSPMRPLQPGEVGVYTPEAGWVHAENSLRASLQAFERAGGEARFHSPVDRERLERDFDAFAVCAGSWIKDFVPALDVEASQRTVAYLDGSLGGPVWIEDSPDNVYGFPSEPGGDTFKVGVHGIGRSIDPNEPSRPPDPASLAAIRDAIARRFDHPSPTAREALGCLYTSTPDEDFRLGCIGPSGFYASACSGHGFKFGPWIGRLLADFIESKDHPRHHPRFHRPTRQPHL